MVSGLSAGCLASPIGFEARTAFFTLNEAAIAPAVPTGIDKDLNFATPSLEDSWWARSDSNDLALITTEFDSDLEGAPGSFVTGTSPVAGMALIGALGSLGFFSAGVFGLSRRTRPRRRDNGQFHRRKLAGEN
jgi:hypothetical protein